MPNFSLHLWQAAATTAAETAGTETTGVWVWSGPAAPTTCRDTVTRVLTDMARLDTLLTRLTREGRRVAAFGLSEVYWLCRAYSSLANFPLVCGLDDAPENPEYARLAFPVRTPETFSTSGSRTCSS